MLKIKQNSKAQSITEYAVLLGIVSLALIGMQVYMKRGLQAAVKDAANELGPQENAQLLINFKRQEETRSETTTKRGGSIQTQTFSGGGLRRDTDTKVESTSTSTSTAEER